MNALGLARLVVVLGIIALILGAAISFSGGITDAARIQATEAKLRESYKQWLDTFADYPDGIGFSAVTSRRFQVSSRGSGRSRGGGYWCS